ncbi:Zinc-binding dehydrogenase family oxidoreductase [Paraburkholderia piptadeniae]|uniref:Alcohol dehydrogenase catalytic domain-containing protein n=2 Tax=Paraburkholderia TaxID=1822464 RepID=A0A7X1NB90_9BURK|nr:MULTISPECIES: alcohol dehydrogenase catalytic domain-containing protein [Paraburkholderia]MPW18740.1 alcohol dehydrogenase catalytic domain-containing protein [Paraburkholderia franconis]SIT48282.1 Zinc-binding dehydrogenase family oxidoreductase [Paraburkholderia piptadeniae]
MKAIVVREPGGVEVMKVEQVPDPVAREREVVIQIESCGICFHDIAVRNGTLRRGVKMPCIPGHEISGTVVEVGKGVTNYQSGDRVATSQRYHICGECRHCRSEHEALCAENKFLGDWGMVGGYAEYVAVASNTIARIPESVSFDWAAVAACPVGTALNGIRDVGCVRLGESVLITGAGGGLGLQAIQIARMAGAFVIAQTTSPHKVPLLQAAGAHEIVLHERGQDFSGEVKRLTSGKGVDVVVDNVGSPLFESMRKSLSDGGRWVMIGQVTGEFVPFNPAQLFLRNQSMLSVTSSSRNHLDDALVLMDHGFVKPVISEVLSLDDAALGHSLVESGRAAGRVVLQPKR